MADNLYWVSTLVYAITLILFLWNDIKSKRKAVGPEKDCRMMFLWVIIFCLQDMIWGLCQNHIIKGDTLFFLSSTVFHLSTVITTFFWLKYILSFLNDKIKNKLFYLIFDGVVVIFEFIFVIINFFKPVLFSIRDGVYYTEKFRTVTFINQYIVYIVIGLSALFWSLKEEKKSRQKYRAVFCFSLAPIIAGGFQLLYPDAPFYSTGYFLGCIIVHIFIIAKGRELLAKSEVIKSIADIYFSMHIIDMENKKIEPYVEPEEVLKVIGKEKDLQKRLNNASGVISTSPYESSLLNFIDLDSISERMADNNSISFEFVAKKYGWIRISFISLLKENDTQKRVMLASQIINKEKNEQEELIYKSNNDEMTRVFNRRAYQKDMDELIDNKLAEDLLYVAMDVNGLKNVNDSYGHVAGDELLIGASYCMQKCFGEYGNLYRIGGDEFVGILHISKDEFITVKKYFDDTINEWSGENIDEINLSCGYVFAIDHPEMNIVEIAKLADEEMYNEKAMFYAKKGIDRRLQREFNDNLMILFNGMLKINLHDNSYRIVKLDGSDEEKEKSLSKDIVDWFSNYIKDKDILNEDCDEYKEKTNINYIKDYFAEGNSKLSISFRVKSDNRINKYLFEFITSKDYSLENQTILLCIKCI